MKHLDFQFMSDIHLEQRYQIPSITPKSRFLLLAGDIGNPFHTIYDKFIEYVSGLFEEVYVILGNHEYYRNIVPRVHDRMREICEDYPNVYFLNDEYVDITTTVSDGSTETVRLFGGTIWSDISPAAAECVNDYQYIQWSHKVPLRPEHTLQLHRDGVSSIKECCLHEDVTCPCIVMTHHALHEDMNGSVYRDSPNKCAFVTHLPELYRRPIVAFINGHTHVNCNVLENGILFTANNCGYPDEPKTGYIDGKCLRLTWTDDGTVYATEILP